MKLTPATSTTLHDIDLAIGHLKRVRELLCRADTPQSLEKVRALLKSVEGARRHAVRRPVQA